MIESRNEVIVQKHSKQAGMLWGKESAQYMVALKTRYEINRWEDMLGVDILIYWFSARRTFLS